MEHSRFKVIFGGNRVIWLTIVVLFMYSVLSVYSASVQLPGTNTTQHLLKHVFGLLIGIACIYVIHKIPCKYFRKASFLMYWVSIILLIVTWLFAPEVNGAKRWLIIGPVTLQTSDFAKVALIMFLANKLSKKEDEITTLGAFAKSILFPIMLTCFLIMPSNLSTALLVLFEAMVLLFFSSIKRSYFWGLVGVFVVAGGMFFALILYGNITIWRFPTWKARVESWIEGNPSKEDQVQVNNARMAVASGGIMGRGPGNGHAKVKLANAHCDYIFANIVEETGLAFSTLLIWLYIILFYRSIMIVKKLAKQSQEENGTEQKYKFRQYLVLGLTAMIVIQAFSNMAVSTDLMPVTGQTLPFVSYGNSSLVFMGFAIGVILSVSREVEDEKAPIASETEADGDVSLMEKETEAAETPVEGAASDVNEEITGEEVLEMIDDNELNIENNGRKEV
ncbi:MAG: FtsW/RodA/SpoVE family cell cycle protein [Bacteroidales bacterium]|nr:FtsW/RodA/SpoVE family cell cycle protein [Bacteroidales bacterium]